MDPDGEEVQRRECTGICVGPAGRLQKSDPEVVAAGLVIEVIDKGPFLSVVEKHPDHAEAARKGGVFFFDYLPFSPKVITEMFYRISHSEIQSRTHVL